MAELFRAREPGGASDSGLAAAVARIVGQPGVASARMTKLYGDEGGTAGLGEQWLNERQPWHTYGGPRTIPEGSERHDPPISWVEGGGQPA
jgi:hypothetical protein